MKKNIKPCDVKTTQEAKEIKGLDLRFNSRFLDGVRLEIEYADYCSDNDFGKDGLQFRIDASDDEGGTTTCILSAVQMDALCKWWIGK